MENNLVYRGEQSDDQSLGIISMEKVNVFGESSKHSLSSVSCKSINDRLHLERLKAYETLRKSEKSDQFLKPFDVNKENLESLNNTPKLNQTDYVPYRRPKVVNITNLISDETINLENSQRSSYHEKNAKVAFEPAEITARSTCCRSEFNNHSTPRDSVQFSVDEILANSFAPKARNLRESLLNDHIGSSDAKVAPVDCRPLAAESSSDTYNYSLSFPHTAVMSLSKKSNLDDSFGAVVTSFSDSNGGEFKNEDFIDAELMHSKLLTDEIAWAQQYAAIPVATLSEQAKIKANQLSFITSKPFELKSAANSMLADDPNFSLGKFFNMRSENIWDIVPGKSPNKWHDPVALVPDTDISIINSKRNSGENISPNSKAKNKIYSLRKSKTFECYESKDSGNASDASYLLSMSAIDRALCKLDILTDDSECEIINKLKQEARKNRCNKTLCNEPAVKDVLHNIVKSLEQNLDVLKENKENLDPKCSKHDLSKTLSFTESILNSSEMKELNRMESIGKVRSPLSPIENPVPIIQINGNDENNDADIDEWPSTPIKSLNRVHRLKSPKRFNKSPSPPININFSKDSNPREDNNTRNQTKLLNTKSLCSTRLDGDKKNNLPSAFEVSPNSSKLNISPAHLISKKSPSPNSSHSDNPATYDLSPMSSPRSCQSSQTSSPAAAYRSRVLDKTTNSERGLLRAPTAVHRVCSSPGSRKINNVGRPLQMNKSAVSVKSAASVPGRSTSRCSNSSEFSHRDGKLIPLKVSDFQLSWSSTKLRTTARKTMQVKNTSKQRLVVRVGVQGPGFQIIATHGNNLTLQSQECRSIIIDFCPTVLGVAVGTLSFYSPSDTTSSSEPFLNIPLYAYGGHAKIVVYNILQGPVGASFLPMGDMRDLSKPLEKSLRIHNKGSLLAFTYISIDPTSTNMPRLAGSFEIQPSRALIPPGHTIKVKIIFRAKRQDIKNLSKKMVSVLTLGTMRIMSGDEGNRQRIRLIRACMRSNQLAKLDAFDMVCEEFPNEVDMTELEAFKETSEVKTDLTSSIRIQQVCLTVNKDSLDETADSSILSFLDNDETVLFRTVCAASPSPELLEPVDEVLENILGHDECPASSKRNAKWSVRPNILEFDFDVNRRQGTASLLINNLYKSRKYFDITCNQKNILTFMPSKGHIEPNGGQILVVVKSLCEKPPYGIQPSTVLIKVSLENEHIIVPVKISDDNFS